MNELDKINFIRLGKRTTVCHIVDKEKNESVGYYINKQAEDRDEEEYQSLKNALNNLLSHLNQEGENA